LVQKLREQNIDMGGFYTEEIRNGHIREGFQLVTVNGKRANMAHINISSPYKVGKYGVDITALDELVVSELETPHKVYIVDEIGKMEVQSL
jgi:nucleoside-triphosphatase